MPLCTSNVTMKLYKVLFATIAFTFLLLLACNNTSENAKRIRSIDKIRTVDTLYAFHIDSNGVILDTLAMNRIKKNSEGVKVFVEKTSLDDDKRKIVSKKYMRDNDELFYSIDVTMTLVDTFISTHENWIQNGKIQKAISIYKGLNKVDTIHMIYKYESGKDGKLKKMIIFESGGSSILETYYNQGEKPLLDLYLFEGETTEQIRYIYEGGKLVSETKFNPKKERKEILAYGHDKLLTSRKEYIKDSLVSEMVYKKDNKGNNLIIIIK